MMWTEKYKCNECGAEWHHTWDDDKNNDYTKCPNGCNGFDFDEVEE